MDEDLHPSTRWENNRFRLQEQGTHANKMNEYSATTATLSTTTITTTIHQAVRQGNLKVLHVILRDPKNQKDIATQQLLDIPNETAKNLLWAAAEQGHLHVVSFLMDTYNFKMEAMYSSKNTLLHRVASIGHFETTHYLVDKLQPCIDAPDFLGRTPLHHASTMGRVRIVKLLMEHGASIESQSRIGRLTPLHAAALGCTSMYTAATEALQSENNSSTCAPAPVKTVQILLSRGANPLAVSKSGDTPLHYASSKAIAKTLIQHDNTDSLYEQQGSSMALHLLSSVNIQGETPIQSIVRRSEFSSELHVYIKSFVSSIFVIPQSHLQQTAKIRVNAVNHKQDPFQMFLTETIYEVLNQTMIHSMATHILGYLTPLDIMNQPGGKCRNYRIGKRTRICIVQDDRNEYAC